MLIELRPGCFINPNDVSLVCDSGDREVVVVLGSGPSVTVNRLAGEEINKAIERVVREIHEKQCHGPKWLHY